MRLTNVFADFDSQDGYLLLIGCITGTVILAFQYARNQLQLLPASLLLLVIGFGSFVYLRRKSDPIGFRFAFIGAVFLILAYLSWPNRQDWPIWHDQNLYLRMTYELSRGFLSPEVFRVGIGYPILAVPFYYLIGNDALFIPNLVAFLGSTYFAYLFFKSLTNDLIAKVSVLLLMFATTLAYHNVIWWGHGIVVFCLVAISYISLKPLTDWKAFLIGTMIGYVFFTRYTDAVVFLPLLVYSFRKPKIKKLALLAGGLIPFVALTLIAQAIVFGSPFMTPYMLGRTGSGLSYFEGPVMTIYNFILTFIYFPSDISIGMVGVEMEKMTVLIGMFYLIFAPLGAYLLYRKSEKKGLVIAIIASALITVLYSSSYYQFHSGTFGTFPTDFRYLLVGYPYMVLFATFALFSFLKIDGEAKKNKVDNTKEGKKA